VIGKAAPVVQDVSKIAAIWAVEGAADRHPDRAGLRLETGRRQIRRRHQGAVGGALLASMNTASEYGFGAVIAALPGFLVVADALKVIPNPLINEAITVTTLAGITGSASGGMGIALAPWPRPSSPTPTPPAFRLKSSTGSPRWPPAAWTPCPTTAP
jgi:hypothetical protein